mmetsp:Transcript_58169/g.123353  ORF Transcript_58169/g.123353 Transcript_58169/m.123353 type:complete len:209 (-) Transcript_58169:1753-2379(-)
MPLDVLFDLFLDDLTVFSSSSMDAPGVSSALSALDLDLDLLIDLERDDDTGISSALDLDLDLLVDPGRGGRVLERGGRPPGFLDDDLPGRAGTLRKPPSSLSSSLRRSSSSFPRPAFLFLSFFLFFLFLPWMSRMRNPRYDSPSWRRRLARARNIDMVRVDDMNAMRMTESCPTAPRESQATDAAFRACFFLKHLSRCMLCGLSHPPS